MRPFLTRLTASLGGRPFVPSPGHRPKAVPNVTEETMNQELPAPIRPPHRTADQPTKLLDAELIEITQAEFDFDPANAVKHTAESIRRLADNIAAYGLLNNPLVYRDPETGRYRLIAGEGRLRALRLLNWPTVWVRCLKSKPGEQQARDLALIDNLMQEELDPLAFGLYCHDDMRRTGRSARELAKVLQDKFSASTITKHAALVRKLPQDLLQAVREGRLPPAVARVLTPLPDDEMKRQFARLYLDGQVKSGAELAAAIRDAKNGKAAGGQDSFHLEESAIRLTVQFPGGSLPAVEAVLKNLLKDLREHGHKGLAHFKELLAKKANTRRKAAELDAAQSELASHTQTP
jgi:ParB/RepB/Spo0J family partition protein